MKTKRFPDLLHVIVESPENDEPYFEVREDGVFGVEEHDTPIAIYKLVKVGRVKIQKSFVAATK